MINQNTFLIVAVNLLLLVVAWRFIILPLRTEYIKLKLQEKVLKLLSVADELGVDRNSPALKNAFILANAYNENLSQYTLPWIISFGYYIRKNKVNVKSLSKEFDMYFKTDNKDFNKAISDFRKECVSLVYSYTYTSSILSFLFITSLILYYMLREIVTCVFEKTKRKEIWDNIQEQAPNIEIADQNALAFT